MKSLKNVTINEFKASYLKPGFAIGLFVYQIVLLSVSLILHFYYIGKDTYDFRNPIEAYAGNYPLLIAIQAFLTVLIVPAMCAFRNGIGKKEKTADILLPESVSLGAAVWGKVFAVMLCNLFYIVASFPLFCYCFTILRTPWYILLLNVCSILLIVFCYTAFSIMCAAIFKNKFVMLVVSYGMIFIHLLFTLSGYILPDKFNLEVVWTKRLALFNPLTFAWAVAPFHNLVYIHFTKVEGSCDQINLNNYLQFEYSFVEMLVSGILFFVTALFFIAVAYIFFKKGRLKKSNVMMCAEETTEK